MKKLVSYTGILMLVIGVIFLSGCGPEAEEDALQHTGRQDGQHVHDGEETGHIKQEKCPVMGNPINPEIHTEHEGEKVYFCCPGCIGEFNANPEKYSS